MKQPALGSDDRRLLQLHQRHLGLYARVAKKLRFTAGMVSRVATGQRTNHKIMMQLLQELRRLK